MRGATANVHFTSGCVYKSIEKEKQQVADIKSGCLPPFFAGSEPGSYACTDIASLLLYCRAARYLVRQAKQKRLRKNAGAFLKCICVTERCLKKISTYDNM